VGVGPLRRVIGIVAALLLLGGVAAAALVGRGGSERGTAKQPSVVRGLIGSEKADFFADPAVTAALAARGLSVQVDTAGSWSMASTSLKGYDFAFPSSLPPAEEIRQLQHITTEPVRPFYSPLVVIAHRSAVEVLAANGLAAKASWGGWTLRMDAYLSAARKGTDWDRLKGAAAHPELAGALFVTSTDPATSSSGALYLAAVSYLENGRRVVSDSAGVRRTAPLLRRLTAVQGDQKSSSDGPFRDFLSGVGNPLVLVYESQVASLVAQGGPPGDLVVLYPDTTVSSDHTVVGLSEGGRRLAEALRDDPALQVLEARHGFRPQGDPAAFGKAVAGWPGVFDPTLAAVRQAQVPAAGVLSQLVTAAKSEG
jgi:hypothetical protein